MTKLKDLTGKKFGKLTVLKRLPNDTKYNRVMWECLCECGNLVKVSSNSLLTNNTKSCGCLKKQYKHGKSHARIYQTYHDMKGRCYNSKNCNYKNYGARNIKVCQEWLENFTNFYNWAMANGYSYNLTIDRIDVNGNYEPSNCRWVDKKTQNNNRRSNNNITFNKITHNISEWAEILGINRNTINSRIRYGWSIEKIFTTPVIQKGV